MFAAGGFAFVFGCFLGCFLRSDIILPVLIISFVLSAVSVIFYYKKIKYISVALCLFTLSFLVLFINNSINFSSDNVSCAENYTAVVEEISGKVYRNEYIVKIQEGELKDKKVLISSYTFLDAEEGDKVSFKTELKRFDDDFGFNDRIKYASQGIYLNSSEPEEFLNLGEEENESFIEYIRDVFSMAIYKAVPDYAAELADAMLLGNREYLDESVTEGFRLAGGSHFLAVSGLHLSILTSFVGSLLYKLKLKRKISDCLLAAFVILYMFIAGFRFSVIRSAIMTLLVILARFTGRIEDSLTSLSFAGFVICIFNPYAAADIGFILSFTATLGIIIASPYIRKYTDKRSMKNRLLGFITENISISLAACVFAVPISMCYFGHISIMTVFTSIILSIPCTYLIAMGFLAAVLGVLLPSLAVIPGFILTISAKFILWYISLMSPTLYGYMGEASFFVFAAVMLMLLIFIKKPSRSTVILFASVFTALTVISVLCVNLLKRPSVSAERFGYGYLAVVADNKRTVTLTDSKDRYCSVYGIRDEIYDLSEELTLESEKYIIEIKGGYAVVYFGDKKIVLDSSDKANVDCDIYISDNIGKSACSDLNIIITDLDINSFESLLSNGNYIFTEEISFGFENNNIRFN